MYLYANIIYPFAIDCALCWVKNSNGEQYLQAQAQNLKEAIKQGQTNIKDRLSIQLDFTNDKDDMRNGIITFDTIMYKARVSYRRVLYGIYPIPFLYILTPHRLATLSPDYLFRVSTAK